MVDGAFSPRFVFNRRRLRQRNTKQPPTAGAVPGDNDRDRGTSCVFTTAVVLETYFDSMVFERGKKRNDANVLWKIFALPPT